MVIVVLFVLNTVRFLVIDEAFGVLEVFHSVFCFEKNLQLLRR